MSIFEESKHEPRLIDIISLFYFFQVFFYTVNDFKFSYPPVIIILGLIFHGFAAFVWIDHKLPKSRIKSKRLKNIVYKSLLFGLCVTYILSIKTEIQRNDLTLETASYLAQFGLTAMPMFIYFYHLGYRKRKPPHIRLLTLKKRILNIVFVLLLAGTQLIG